MAKRRIGTGNDGNADGIKNDVPGWLACHENWSIWFDLRIMVLTITREILSSHAF